MYSEKLKSLQPFATKFFEAALSLKNNKFAHAYTFVGGDAMAQYNLAVQTAKILNCTNILEQRPDCTCTNCSWIAQNRHPAVITISPIDYLHGNEDGKSKTVITIGQTKYLKQELLKSSQYHRVIIFTDAVEGKENEKNAENLWKNYVGELSPPFLDMSEQKRLDWSPLPLTRKILHSESANALLKTIEEPPPNTTFFFLTKDKENMLETIISRTQVLPVLSNYSETFDLSILEKFFEVFPPKNNYEALTYSDRLLAIAKEHFLSEKDLLVLIQDYLRKILRANASDKAVCAKITDNIQKIEQAQNEIKNYVNKQAVFESLMIALGK